MASYADLVADEEYLTTKTGAALEIVLFESDDPTTPVIGAAAGLNVNESYESVPREEAGNDGVDEHAQGRHRGSLSLNYFWTPDRNDKTPTRQSFIGRRWTVIVRIGKNQPQEGVVVDAFTECTLNQNNTNMAARGTRMGDMSLDFVRRYNGQEWANLFGG